MTDAGWVQEVLTFWFEELSSEDWYSGSADVDEKIRARFGALHEELTRNPPPETRTDADAALAAVIVLDQFSRNLFRKRAEAFASDAMALDLARNALEADFDSMVPNDRRSFFYMPFMHSEVLSDQERCVDLFKQSGGENSLKYAIEHRDIIARFGRFPHRNTALGREPTEEEKAFLEGHSGFGQ
ncbi:MAG: DUF924 domain-containing protein [Rhizobiaceae bacterium]|nr:DUF924 domain-containing protein [Rhizobiaceae bacterium]MCC0042831.1 DUF924 domain-containing protein [Brucellaceae bacterium]